MAPSISLSHLTSKYTFRRCGAVRPGTADDGAYGADGGSGGGAALGVSPDDRLVQVTAQDVSQLRDGGCLLLTLPADGSVAPCLPPSAGASSCADLFALIWIYEVWHICYTTKIRIELACNRYFCLCNCLFVCDGGILCGSCGGDGR